MIPKHLSFTHDRSGRWYFCLSLVLLLSTSSALAQEIRVAVASNFVSTLSEISLRFQQKTGHKVTLIPGSTGKHFAQIIQGAPFDLFFAADSIRPEQLEQQGYIIRGSRFTYATGKVVLWSPVKPHPLTPEALNSDSVNFLSIANPRLAPYGKAAQEILNNKQLWKPMQGRIVVGENIAQAYHFVASGNAQIGFVAWSQVLQRPEAHRGGYWHPPVGSYTPIHQQAVLLNNHPIAVQFSEFVQSSEIQQLIARHGYLATDRNSLDGHSSTDRYSTTNRYSVMHNLAMHPPENRISY